MADQDDIIRNIDLESEEECATEIERLTRKRRGLKAAFTEYINIVDRLMKASQGDENRINKSEDNRIAIQRAFEKLELRYEKLQKLNHRVFEINLVADDEEAFQEIITLANNAYLQRVDEYGRLRIAMLPNPNQQGAAGLPEGRHLRPVEALKPSFSLSFDNSPTELSTWLSQFKSYFEASRLQNLPLDQQQAFLRQGLAPDLWTVIKQRINIQTQIFKNQLQPEEESCESVIEAQFQVRYPLIMRRYRFFTYERKGNQTYSDFYAKLQELATAANLENLEMNDYLCFRVIAGMNDSKIVDKILSIPAQDFNLEEINRVAVACEAARNYSSLNSRNVSNKVFDKKNSYQKPSSTQDKLKALKQQGKCVRCGKNNHSKGETCPHKSTVCHKCGIKGHISPVCAQSNPKSKARVVSQTKQANQSNYTFAGATHGPRRTPRQKMSFQNSNIQFWHEVIPDSGSSRTIFGKSLLNKKGIKFEPNLDSEELYNASSNPMTVNGTVKLTTTFNGKSKLIDGLVSEDLEDEVLLSWYDAEDLGSLSITRFASLGNPSQRIDKSRRNMKEF